MTMDPRERDKANRRLMLWMLSAAVGMFGFGFALAPLYDVFCDITGLNGKTGGRVEAATLDYAVQQDRTVTLEFVTSVNMDESWTFQPTVTKLRVHPGEVYDTVFVAENPSAERQTIQAVPSVTPGRVAQHLHKTECFCFTRQVFEPGERREMPLRFVIDPELPEDVTTLSLAYTLFNLDEPAGADTPAES